MSPLSLPAFAIERANGVPVSNCSQRLFFENDNCSPWCDRALPTLLTMDNSEDEKQHHFNI